MTIQQTIQKAIEGGYKSPCCNIEIRLAEHLSEHQEMILLDPLFWQCLGKAMGWEKSCQDIIGDENSSSVLLSDAIKAGRERAGYYPLWIYYWHRFIDHLAEDGTIESFFESLN